MAAFGSVPELEETLYPAAGVDTRGCVTRLRRGGPAGCGAPGASGRAAGALELWAGAEAELPAGRFALVRAGAQAAAALRALAAGPARPPSGVLVLSPGAGGEGAAGPSAWSPVGPLERGSHAWNPAGAGSAFLGARFGAPVFALGPEDSERALAWAEANANAAFAGDLWEAEAAARMWAADSAGSLECLQDGLCLPLGGYSPLLRLPVHGEGPPDEAPLPVVLVAAQLDSAALFAGSELGAGSAAGLVAGLAAMEAVRASLDEKGARGGAEIAFVGLAGEPWGGLGSARVQAELAGGGLGGREVADVRGVLAVGAVSGSGLLTSHNCSDAGGSEASENLVATVLAEVAAGPLQGGGSLKASRGQFGAPPGLCEALGQQRVSGAAPLGPVAALENFEASFSNAFYQGYLDAPPLVSLDTVSVAAAAELVALAALRLADPHAAQAHQVDFPRLNATVHSLAECLGTADPGLRCSLAQELMSPPAGSAPVPHYVGVLSPSGAASDALDPADKEPLELFVWNWLARVGAQPGSSEAACGGKKFGACAASGEVCVGWRPEKGNEGAGQCLKSPATYVPAWPGQLFFEESSGLWAVDASQDDPDHPLWTESYWPAGHPGLRFLQRNSKEGATFLLGLAVLFLSLVTAYASRAIHRRRHSRR